MARELTAESFPETGSELVCLRRQSSRISIGEIALLLAVGAAAAWVMGAIHLSLRVPGHAIFKPLLPMTLGLALVPRKASGSVMGLGAALMSGAMLVGGFGDLRASAMTSLLLLGPALDVAARGTHAKRILLVRFAIAGLVTNLIAVGVKLAATSMGLETGGGRGFFALWPVSLFSFIACGALAGLASAAICLAVSRRGERG